MTKEQDIIEINETIIYLKSARNLMMWTGKLSNNIYQSQFDQFIRSLNETIRSLEKIQESLQTELDEQRHDRSKAWKQAIVGDKFIYDTPHMSTRGNDPITYTISTTNCKVIFTLN